MIGPAIQAALFLSIIYWYSKGMLSLINDYYRDEFKSYIDKDAEKEATSQTTKILEEPEVCPAKHMEGLPDVLKSINENTKPDGIVVRHIDKSPQCNPPEIVEDISEPINNNKPFIFNSEISMESSNHPRYTRPSWTAKDEPQKNLYKSKSILNPSQIGQSNYRQMSNQQQASDTADGKSTRTSSSPASSSAASSLNRNNGNCFENDGAKAGVHLQRVTDKCYPASSIATPSTSKIKSKVAPMPPTTPKIALNGVLVPAELVRQRLDEKLRKESCQRKTVNEMVQYWTNYLEAVETKEQTSVPFPRRKSASRDIQGVGGGGQIKPMPRARSSGEIRPRKRTFNLTPDS